MNSVISNQDFKVWLEGQIEEGRGRELLGKGDRMCSCPLAKWLEVHLQSSHVDVGSDGRVWTASDTVWASNRSLIPLAAPGNILDENLLRFVRLVDYRYQGESVSIEKCLALLNEVTSR